MYFTLPQQISGTALRPCLQPMTEQIRMVCAWRVFCCSRLHRINRTTQQVWVKRTSRVCRTYFSTPGGAFAASEIVVWFVRSPFFDFLILTCSRIPWECCCSTLQVLCEEPDRLCSPFFSRTSKLQTTSYWRWSKGCWGWLPLLWPLTKLITILANVFVPTVLALVPRQNLTGVLTKPNIKQKKATQLVANA